MDVAMLLNSLATNPEDPILYPWEGALHLATGLRFYINWETGNLVFDLRPLVRIGSSLVLLNPAGNLVTMGPLSWTSLASSEHPEGSMNLHTLLTFSNIFLFTSECTGVAVHMILARPLVFCPFCTSLLLYYRL
ncbi:hypothetical protein L6164_009098 [Bauhinia variegata]|uniref:Uncharacterized protein n=1 Tax=Bauhinia variegata TaxID=167791 RepID=A0ACB9PIV2_BAUVA|nr:hypothetical protein L6164_009098 [Bauhinia variegata]